MGEIDTVVVAFTDMQGRLQGKRLHAAYFVDVVLDVGVEGCNYLLGVDVDMNTVDGYAMTSWDKGYGDMEFVLDFGTIRLLPHLPATVMIQADLVLTDQRRWSRRRGRSSSTSWSGRRSSGTSLSPGPSWSSSCSRTPTRARGTRATATWCRATSTTSTTRSSARRGSSRCCATSATTCTLPG